ncbi:hypothetical protein LZ198_37510 [Myxococcus sp. K15C18031901]|uniref:hypothetical protein n=1 Tax=Myxococcus dinghuensis TaxID=2906761 RepID=UPI0020A7E24D|nr:hypothetical protein [Myxococcus dinghuensis]MCP3104576.1 hypothetical protein [Myxococcus dinghuensis]
MSGASSRLVVRVPALLFSVAVVGALIGTAWEGVVYGKQGASDEWTPPPLPAFADPEKAPGRTAAEEAALQRALVHFPPYPNGSRAELLAVDYLGPEVPISVAWFTTQDSADQVLSHYKKVLQDKGIPVVERRHGENGGWVGYWSEDMKEMRLVSVLSQGGETLGFVSAGEMEPLLKRASKVPAWIPLPADLTGPTSVTFDMEGASHHLVSGPLTTQTPAEAAERYRALFQEKGWSVAELEQVDAGGIAFDVTFETVSGRALLRPRVPEGGVELQLSLLQRGSVQ